MTILRTKKRSLNSGQKRAKDAKEAASFTASVNSELEKFDYRNAPGGNQVGDALNKLNEFRSNTGYPQSAIDDFNEAIFGDDNSLNRTNIVPPIVISTATTSNTTDNKFTRGPVSNFDYRALLVPGRKENNQFQLSDYYWYPEGLTHFYKDDLFETAEEQFDVVDSPGVTQGFIGTAINDIRNEISSAVKFVGDVKDQINSVRDKFNNIFNPSKNKKRGEKTGSAQYQLEKDSIELFKTIPHINVTEIQPQQGLEFTINLFKQIGDLANFWFEGKGDMNRIKQTFAKIKSSLPQGGAIAGFLDSSVDAEKAVLAIPNFLYTQLIGGTVRGKYKIPLSTQDTYWNARGSSGWEARTLQQQFFSNFGASFIKKIPGVGQFDIAGRPRFISANETHDEFTTEFNLFNYNDIAIKANMKFIHSFIAGAWWTQTGILQSSSNLYDVEVPGRFRYLFCTADIKVDQVGKIRKLPQKVIGSLKDALGKKNSIRIADNFDINEAYISMVPDTYRVTVTFKSLLPNNLNTYLAYALKQDSIKDLYEGYDIGNSIESGIDKIFEGINPNTSSAENVFQKLGDFDIDNLASDSNVSTLLNNFDIGNPVKGLFGDTSSYQNFKIDKNKYKNFAVDKVKDKFGL